MERPFFSLAKKPRKTMINYEVGGTIVTVCCMDLESGCGNPNPV